jgi:hypothetical protein
MDFSYQVLVCNGGSDCCTTFSATGLPPGLTLNKTTGLISGKPTQSGIFSINLEAKHSKEPVPATKLLRMQVVAGAVTAPQITVHPQNQTVAVGGTASFTVTATGTAPLTYQWLHGGFAVGGVTTSNLTINPVTETDEGSYTVRVSNAAGEAISDPATLTVLIPPVITTQPTSVSAHLKEAIVLHVTAQAAGALTYQWLKGGLNINGATQADFAIPEATVEESGDYTVTVTSDGLSTTSAIAKVTVVALTLGVPILYGDNITLNFASIPGRTYELESKHDFNAANWLVTQQTTAIGTTSQLTDAIGGDPVTVWRIRVKPPGN